MLDDWIPSPSDLGPDPEPLGLRAGRVTADGAWPKLLVGFDGSAGSRRAVEWAARARGRLLVTVVAVPGRRADLELPETMLDGVAWRPLVVAAPDAAAGLLLAAHRHAPAAIVVGADDPGLGGDVTERLMRMSDVPVIVIPTDGQQGFPWPADSPS